MNSRVARLILVAGVVAAVALSAGCPRRAPEVEAPPAGTPIRGDTLVIGGVAPMVLNPILATDVPSGTINDLVFSGLVRANHRLEFEPDLAESWEMSQDGLVWTFHLRDNVAWHDGAPFTAEDVAFTLERIRDEATITVRRADYEQVERWEVVDPHTFRVYLKEPFAPALQIFAIGILPKHLLQGVDVNTAPFNTNPVGTGPFRFREWKPDVHVILDRNEDYFGQVPYLDSIVFRAIPDDAVRMEELAGGGIDYTGILPVQYERMKALPHLAVHTFPALRFEYFGWNERLPLFDDDRVRNALGLALDREAMAVAAYEGFAVPATGPFPPVSWAVDPAVEPLGYDPERAKQLLAEAGWRDTDGDGWLDRDGKRFEFEFLGRAGDPSAKMVIELAMEYYRAVGVKLNPLFLEWSDLVSRLDPPRRAFEAFFLGFTVGIDPDVHIFYHSTQAEAGFNDTNFQDAEADRLIDEGRSTMDFAARKQIYHQLHRRLHETQPVTFMFFSEAILGVDQRFQGVVPSPIGSLWNVEHWWVPAAQQKHPAP
ncbi:MAG TPA: peptide-binding protein [Bryobacteraceae bacterium]|nr:peptide-binding protein [Bryobacteraceae bacterium]